MVGNTLKDEAQWVQKLSKGSHLAFNTLFYEYSDRLFRFAIGYLKSQEEARELVQEVFTRIWEKRGDLKSELSFKSFLFTIAYNLIKKHFRTRVYLEEYIRSRETEVEDKQSSENVTYNSLYQHINELVDQLPDRRRQIFIKSRFEGQNIKKIAEELNISHKTVENQITEALRFIRIHLNMENAKIILFFHLFL